MAAKTVNAGNRVAELIKKYPHVELATLADDAA